jgi:hypothetical protein
MAMPVSERPRLQEAEPARRIAKIAPSTHACARHWRSQSQIQDRDHRASTIGPDTPQAVSGDNPTRLCIGQRENDQDVKDIAQAFG